MSDTIAIIGAGMAGLTCARLLSDAGRDVVVLDKGRGIGGRLATRRTDIGVQFDHGAQYISPKTEEFGKLLLTAEQDGYVALWDDGQGDDHFVGTPGMNGLAKYLAQGLPVRQKALVTAVWHEGDEWQLEVDGAQEAFGTVVCTTPAPQTIALLGNQHPVSVRLRDVSYHPCLTLMVALEGRPDAPVVQRDPAADLSWIAEDSTKPDRPEQSAWVAQAGPQWSTANLEGDLSEICTKMLPLFLDRMGVSEADVRHAAAHRWRYSSVSNPLGASFAQSDDGHFFAGGDWCLGPRVESAWTSGRAIAHQILGLA